MGGPACLCVGTWVPEDGPEEAEGRLPKAASWSTWVPLAGLGGG